MLIAGLFQGVLAGLLVAFIYFRIIRFYFEVAKLRHIKGPPAIPLLGNLYDLRALSWHSWLDSLRNTYGKMFRVFVFNRPYVVILDKRAAREVLTDDAFVKTSSYSNLATVFGQGLFISHGAKHAADRALLSRFFTLPNLLKDLDVMCEFTKNVIDKVASQGASKDWDILDVMTEIASHFVFFVSVSAREKVSNYDDLMKIMFNGSRIIGEHMFLDLPGIHWRLKMSGVLGPLKEFYRYLDVEIEEHKKLYAASPGNCPDDVLTALISQHPPCSNQEIYDHVVTFMSAGTESTAYCLAYTILLLARHPEVQQRLKREVKKVLGQRTHITPEDYAQLTYATRIIQESLRIYSAGPHISRLATKPVKLESSGIVIPEGTEVLLSFYLMSRDVEEWGAPIDTFNPDRFLTAGPGGQPVTRDAPNKGYMPFSFGKRACIGATLVLVEGTVVLALMAQRFTFHEVPGFEPQITLGFTLTSKNRVRVRIDVDDNEGYSRAHL